ncbi:MAG: hypothetical protein AAGI66_05265 [Cyanobacteria bacterium P01_H01_bin.74]
MTNNPKKNNPENTPKDRLRSNLITRLKMLYLAKTDTSFRLKVLTLCERDILFWFTHFCWTFDPRKTQPHQPFLLYDFQKIMVPKLQHAINTGQDLLIEKSRDMGISWLVLLVFQHYWLFHKGANMHLGSRKQESVDRKGDISTLLEKVRYNLYRMPVWMRPKGFAEGAHDNLLRVMNPENGNSITGESSNENFGRGGRYRAVLFDEFPFWPAQDAAYASAGQSTPCRIAIGTPYGKNNRFAQLRFSGQTEVLTVHWQEHPNKDAAWYAMQKKRLTEDELARELDINYHLSVRDRVFREFGPAHKREIVMNLDRPIIRSWDFGYHCPACVFVQVDSEGRVLVLAECVGQEVLLTQFAQTVLDFGNKHFPGVQFQDVCDPAGNQRSDKHMQTSIEMLNSLKIYPTHYRSYIQDGIALIRLKLMPQEDGHPGLLVHPRCKSLIEAFDGGYRYSSNNSERPVEEHPYEDVMDCLRYAVLAKCRVSARSGKQKATQYIQPHLRDKYTRY